MLYSVAMVTAGLGLWRWGGLLHPAETEKVGEERSGETKV